MTALTGAAADGGQHLVMHGGAAGPLVSTITFPSLVTIMNVLLCGTATVVAPEAPPVPTATPIAA
jgi:hypothetical protein